MPDEEDIAPLLSSLQDMDARGAALIMASILDNMLEYAITLFFVELGKTKFDNIFRSKQAPLASFSSKISVAYALGIITDEVRAQLDRVRSIRNAFAHSMKAIDFDHEIVASECNKLSPSVIYGSKFAADTPREKFLSSATVIGIAIISFIKDREEAIGSGDLKAPETYVCKFFPLHPQETHSREEGSSSVTAESFQA